MLTKKFIINQNFLNLKIISTCAFGLNVLFLNKFDLTSNINTLLRNASIQIIQQLRWFKLQKSVVFFVDNLNPYHDTLKYYYARIRLNGLGYRIWKLTNNKIIFDIGFSHYYCFDTTKCPVNLVTRKNKLFLYSTEKRLLSQLIHFLKMLRFPNPYSLKGIHIGEQTHYKKSKRKER